MIDGGLSDRTARMFDALPGRASDYRGTWVVEPKRLVQAHPPGCMTWAGRWTSTPAATRPRRSVVRRIMPTRSARIPKPWLRHRVHHAYFPTPRRRWRRMAEAQHSRAVVSSPFLTNLGEGFVNSVGHERASRAMPMRTYLDAGVPLAGSSDSYITDFNPWVGMHAAVIRHHHHRPRSGKRRRRIDRRGGASLLHARRSIRYRPRRSPGFDLSRQARRPGRARPRSAGDLTCRPRSSQTNGDHVGWEMGLPGVGPDGTRQFLLWAL